MNNLYNNLFLNSSDSGKGQEGSKQDPDNTEKTKFPGKGGESEKGKGSSTENSPSNTERNQSGTSKQNSSQNESERGSASRTKEFEEAEGASSELSTRE